MKIAIVFGTRPEIIKLSTVIAELKRKRRITTVTMYTGQHYNSDLRDAFLSELDIPPLDYDISVGSSGQVEQTGIMMTRLEKLYKSERPDVVLVQGDTNSTLAGALTAAKLSIPVAHIEAGLRCFERKMPEEINRLLSDQLSDLCFAPTEVAVRNLLREGKDGTSIELTGNTIVDVVSSHLHQAAYSNILERLEILPSEYVVMTMHRAENADNPQRMKEVFTAIRQLSLRVVFPIHPRSLNRLRALGLYTKFKRLRNLSLTRPLGFHDFLKLCANSMFIITDSGGIQEECTIYMRPVIIARNTTERPEPLGVYTFLAGCSSGNILRMATMIRKNLSTLLDRYAGLGTPFGNGHASEKIVYSLRSRY